ncbi:MAG: ISL3 family transposase [Acidobacteriota bacterium]
MATTSFLYYCLGLQGYTHLRTEYRNGATYHHVALKHEGRRCAECGARSWHLTLEGSFEREFNALPVGNRRQFLVLHGHRQACRECGALRREPVGFAKGRCRHMKTFARYVVGLCGLMALSDVARLLGIGWDRAKQIFKDHLSLRLRRRRTAHVRRIGVDEFAVSKGHRYMTVVVDLDSGEILHAHEGKDAAALVPFLLRLKRSRAPIEAVAMDLSASYIKAVRSVWGNRVAIVHDRYHVVALANKAVDDTRRDLVRFLGDSEAAALKRTRFLWLKGAENLEAEALDRLVTRLARFEPLFTAWSLKETLRDFWEMPDRDIGALFLDAWTATARRMGNVYVKRLADTLDAHRDGLLAYFEHPITNASVEGINNKIKVLKRQAYGFRDNEFFKLRLYFLHEAKLTLAG